MTNPDKKRAAEYMKFPKRHLADNETIKDQIIRRLEQELNRTVNVALWDSGHLESILEYHPASRHWTLYRAHSKGIAATGRAGDTPDGRSEGIL